MKKNLPLIVALALPLLVVGIVLISVSVPAQELDIEHKVIFAVNNEPYGNYQDEYVYIVSDGRVERFDIQEFNESQHKRIRVPQEEPKLYIYDFETEELSELSSEEAGQFEIVKTGNISPEGYHLSYGYAGGSAGIFDLFGGYSGNYGWKIEKGNMSVFKELPDTSGIYWNADILGWVR